MIAHDPLLYISYVAVHFREFSGNSAFLSDFGSIHTGGTACGEPFLIPMGTPG